MIWARQDGRVAALQIGLDEGDPPGKKPPGWTPPAHRGPKPERRAWMRACCWRGSMYRADSDERIGMYWGRWGPDRRCVLAMRPLRGSISCARAEACMLARGVRHNRELTLIS